MFSDSSKPFISKVIVINDNQCYIVVFWLHAFGRGLGTLKTNLSSSILPSVCDLHCTWHSQCSRKLKEIYCLYNFLSWLSRTRSTSKCIARPCQRRQFYYIHVLWKRANLISQKCFRPSRCLQNEQTPKFDTREIVTSMKDEIITASGPSTERHGKKIFLTSSEEEVPISVRLAGAPINEPKNVEPMTHFLLIIICWWEYSRSPEIFNSIFGHSFAFYALSEWLLVFLSLRFSNCFFFLRENVWCYIDKH